MMKTTFFLTFIFIKFFAFSQEMGSSITPLFGLSNTFQQKDYLLGFDIGLPNNNHNLHYLLSFDFRPHGRKVQEFAGNNLFYQYQEKRYVLTIGARYIKELRQSGKGVFIGFSGGYNFGSYRGLNLNPEQGWIVKPNGGLFWDILPDFFTLQLGYEYFNSRSDTVTDHWVFLTCLFIINNHAY